MSLLGLCQWLAETRGSVALHESIYMYPLVEFVHVLTVCVFVGMSVLLDLRLMGVVLPQVRASEMAARLLPWMKGGFAVMIITGGPLFYCGRNVGPARSAPDGGGAAAGAGVGDGGTAAAVDEGRLRGDDHHRRPALLCDSGPFVSQH